MEKLGYPGVFHCLSQIFLFEQFQSPSCSVFKRYMCCVTQNTTKNIRNNFQDTKHFVKVWKHQRIWKYVEREWIYMTQTLVWRLVNTALMSQDVFLHCNCKHSKISLPESILKIEESRQTLSGIQMLSKVCCLEYLLLKTIKWFTLKGWSLCFSDGVFAK